MRTLPIVASLVLGFFLSATGLAQEKGDGKSPENLDGKWYTFRHEKFGNLVPAIVANRLTLVIDGSKMEWYIGNPAPNMAATFTLDPDKKTIDAKVTRGSLNTRTMLGIYKIADGMLHICWAEIDAKRPEQFATTKPGGGVFEYVIYSRTQNKGTPPDPIAKGFPDKKGPPAGQRPKLADLKLTLPKGWEAKYSDLPTWRIAYGGFDPSIAAQWFINSRYPKDLDELQTKMQETDYFGNGLYLTTVSEKGQLPDGIYLVGKFKMGKNSKESKYAGFILIRDFGGEKLVFESFSTSYDNAKLLREALDICKSAKFAK
jgi:uncharacterized protein (TIGR03067 family)